MRLWKPIVVFCLLLAPLAFTQDPPHPLTNDDVYVMLQLGFSEDLVLQKIRNAPQTNFDTSVAALRILKEVNASEKIIMAMIDPKSITAQPAAPSEPAPPPMPEEVGIYAAVKSKLVELMPETVNWKSSGLLKSLATVGMTSGEVNGTIKGPKSANALTAPVEIIIRTIEGGSPADYQLFRCDVRKDHREFRAVMGAGAEMLGSKDTYRVEFQFEKIAPRIFRVKLKTLPKGEYGFLPPGPSGNVGRIHSFSVND